MKLFLKTLSILFSFAILFAGSLFSQNKYSILKASDLSDSLVAFYPFNGNANDESGNGNDGINYGATPTEDRFGNPESALFFNGVNDYVVFNDSSFDFSTQFSVSFWLKTNSTHKDQRIFFKNQSSPNRSWFMSLNFSNEGKLDFFSSSSGSNSRHFKSQQKYNDGTWHHVVLTYDGNNQKAIFYCDGTVDAQDESAYSFLHLNDQALSIGNSTGGVNFYNGSLDDIRFFNCAINKNSIDSLYHENGWPLPAMSMLDQYQLGIDYGFIFYSDIHRWQEFRPTKKYLDSLEVFTQKNENPSYLILQIRDSLDSVINQLSIEGNKVPEYDWLKIKYKEPVPLTPGNKYKIYMYCMNDSLSSGDFVWRGSTESTYDTTCYNSVNNSWPDFDFAFKTFGFDEVDAIDYGRETKPDMLTLFQNYPNPFNPSTTIKFSLPLASQVKLEIFNALGQRVSTLLNKKMTAGRHSVTFNGSVLASGVYYFKITAGKFTQVKKMLLIK